MIDKGTLRVLQIGITGLMIMFAGLIVVAGLDVAGVDRAIVKFALGAMIYFIFGLILAAIVSAIFMIWRIRL